MDGRRRASAAAAALLVLALAGCGGGPPLARVGERSITKAQVDRLVEHGREEAVREGADFPTNGSDGYRALQREALAILVARAQIVEAARLVGISVSTQELDDAAPVPKTELVEALYEGARRHLGVAEENEKGTSARLLADAVRVQLTLQKVERRVGAAGLQAWVERARRLPVGYADGWKPRGVE